MDLSGVSNVLDLQKQVANTNTKAIDDEKFDAVLSKAMESKDNTELKTACDELESYMLGMMFKQMKSSMLTGESIIGKGDYEKMFEDTYANSLCQEMVKAGGVGLSDAIYRQMTNTYGNQMQMSSQHSGEGASASKVNVNQEI